MLNMMWSLKMLPTNNAELESDIMCHSIQVLMMSNQAIVVVSSLKFDTSDINLQICDVAC